MERTPAERALRAAEALHMYLRDRVSRSALVDVSNAEAPPGTGAEGVLALEQPDAAPKNAATAAAVEWRGETQDGGSKHAPLCLKHPDWLYHRLTITGPGEPLGRFRVAAAGSGIVPWQLDLDRIQEDSFYRLAGAGQLSLEGARVLSGQLGEAVARVGRSHACPFDLHSLVPVLNFLLCLGPDHPDAQAWLWAQWGTTEALRPCRRGRQARSTPEGPDRDQFLVGRLDALAGTGKNPGGLAGAGFETRPEYGAL